MNNINPLERAVMQAFLAGDDPVLSILRAQFERAKATNKEFTGVGFYTTFTAAPETSRIPGNRSFNLGDVVADIAGTNGATFLLLVRDGLLHMLEGCTYGSEQWPTEITTFEVGYRVGN